MLFLKFFKGNTLKKRPYTKLNERKKSVQGNKAVKKLSEK